MCDRVFLMPRSRCLIVATAVWLLTAAGATPAHAQQVSLVGAGASFPAPLYVEWFRRFDEANPDVSVNYQSVGSGAGIQQFTRGIVDFAASDAAMSDREIRAVDGNVLMIPMTAGGIVFAFNLPGIDTLALSQEAAVGLASGDIRRWNDPRIAATNCDASLPDLPVTWVHRSDGSGTTYVFSGWLAANDARWAARVGQGKRLTWPGLNAVGGKGNAGVAAIIGQTPGAVGYIEFGYAMKSSRQLPMASLENEQGRFIAPSVASCTAALASFELPPNLRAFEFRPSFAEAYPIVTLTWILAKPVYDDANQAQALVRLLTWCLGPGQEQSADLGYIPLPETMTRKIVPVVASMELGQGGGE